MDFLQKYVHGVFDLPLPRNAKKRTKKNKGKKSAGGWVGLGFSKCTVGSVDFFCRPLESCSRLPVIFVPPFSGLWSLGFLIIVFRFGAPCRPADCGLLSSHVAPRPERPPKKKKPKGQKDNRGKKQPTDFPFCLGPLRRPWTCHRMLAPAAGGGNFLYELVPSDDPFLWCLCETILFLCGKKNQKTEVLYFLRKIN
jgi:hypothetical protein